jgi:hypothetical protein
MLTENLLESVVAVTIRLVCKCVRIAVSRESLFVFSLFIIFYARSCVGVLSKVATNAERVCEEAVFVNMLLHGRSAVDYCFPVER